MTVLLTGAHVTPAVATIQALREMLPSARVVYVGRSHPGFGRSLEREELERVGAEFFPIVFGKIHRFWTIQQFIEMAKMPIGLVTAGKIVARVRPQVLVSFGGYTSVPLVLAAWFNHTPIVVHEQTCEWGFANRLARRLASAVAISWPILEEPGVVLTGNPLRRELLTVTRKPGRQNLLYVTGGSQGSLAIDRVLVQLLPRLVKEWDVYHQTRSLDPKFDHPRYHRSSWFPATVHARILARTAVSVSRAGANTVSELMYLGIPSLLIPLPHAGGGEQLKNAQMMASTGLARILPQRNLTAENMLKAIGEVRQRISDRTAIAKAKELVRVDAARDLARLISGVVPKP